jgi:hypothetical protein
VLGERRRGRGDGQPDAPCDFGSRRGTRGLVCQFGRRVDLRRGIDLLLSGRRSQLAAQRVAAGACRRGDHSAGSRRGHPADRDGSPVQAKECIARHRNEQHGSRPDDVRQEQPCHPLQSTLHRSLQPSPRRDQTRHHATRRDRAADRRRHVRGRCRRLLRQRAQCRSARSLRGRSRRRRTAA